MPCYTRCRARCWRFTEEIGWQDLPPSGFSREKWYLYLRCGIWQQSPDLSLTRNSSTCRMVQPSPSCFKPVSPCTTELLPLLSRETILWHRQCTTVLTVAHSVPQKVAHGTTYDRGRSSDRHAAQSPCLRLRRGHAAMPQPYVEPSVSRRRPLEPKRRAHAHAQGPGHLYCDLPAPAGRSA